MIRLACETAPPLLRSKEEEWGEEHARALADGSKPPHRYRREDVKVALRHETKEKCAYCESFIAHIAYEHIEHLVPKSLRPLLVCVWENLTLACQVCNTNKRDYFSEEAPLLNPYEDDVESELTFYGPMAVPPTDKAQLTIAKLKLNRSALLFRRAETLNDILRIFDLLARSFDNPSIAAALQEEVADRLADEAEYASCARCFSEDQVDDRGAELPLADMPIKPPPSAANGAPGRK